MHIINTDSTNINNLKNKFELFLFNTESDDFEKSAIRLRRFF